MRKKGNWRELKFKNKKNYKILIGDAKGIDKTVQNCLKALGYKNVEIYYIGDSPRNIVDDDWKSVRIPVEKTPLFFKNNIPVTSIDIPNIAIIIAEAI